MRDKLNKEGSIKGDNSVHSCSNDNAKQDEIAKFHRRGAPSKSCCEFISRPYQPKSYRIKSILEVFERAYKSEEYHFNNSCGFHIHYSFDNPDTGGQAVELYSLPFYNYFINRVKESYPTEFEQRTTQSTYCLATRKTNNNIATSPVRYFAINFLGAWEKHKTLEFRIWPADTAQKMRDYINFTTNCIQTFLDNQDKMLKYKDSVDLFNLQLQKLDIIKIASKRPIEQRFLDNGRIYNKDDFFLTAGKKQDPDYYV